MQMVSCKGQKANIRLLCVSSSRIPTSNLSSCICDLTLSYLLEAGFIGIVYHMLREGVNCWRTNFVRWKTVLRLAMARGCPSFAAGKCNGHSSGASRRTASGSARRLEDRSRQRKQPSHRRPRDLRVWLFCNGVSMLRRSFMWSFAV